MRLLAAALVFSAAVFGQAEKFQVSSVHPCDPKAPHGGVSGSPGVLLVTCATVRTLIDWTYSAYSNGPHFNAKLSLPLEGAPAWVESERYTINAKATGRLEVLSMFSGAPMRALLEDRFKLELHRASREVPVYALVAGKGNPPLERAEEDGCEAWEDPWDHPLTPPLPFLKRRPLCRTLQSAEHGLDVAGATLKELAELLPLDRPVIDQTGLRGAYNFHLDLFFGDLGIPGGAAGQDHTVLRDPAARVEPVRSALRKIGLDLQATNGPRETLVIDRIERPGQK